MRLPTLDERGQTAAVNAQLTIIISLIVAIIVVYQLFIADVGPTSDEYISGAAGTLLNTSLSDNTGDVPDNWENVTEPVPSYSITNAWNAGGYLTVTRTDNGDNMENGIWYQSLTIASVGDGVTAATLTYRYRVIDNENAGSIVVMVLLDDGTDNTTLLNENVTENESASWTSGEDNVMDNITAAGTYTVWLRTEINPAHSNAGAVGNDASSCIVGWDEVNLSISAEITSNPDYDADALSTYNRVVTLAWAGIGLMAIAIIILAASVILGVVRGFGGGGKV